MLSVPPEERWRLSPLFDRHRYDMVIGRAVLEGWCGEAWADNDENPGVARLDSGAFTLVGGDASLAAAKTLLARSLPGVATPPDRAWESLIRQRLGDACAELSFVECLPERLDAGRLKSLAEGVAAGYALRRIDAHLGRRLAAGMELAAQYFLEQFASLEDFLARGAGWCVLSPEGRIAAVATSMVRASDAVEVAVETASAHRRRGLAATVAAALVLECLEKGIRPAWVASNEDSVRLAERLGYQRGDSYVSLAPKALTKK